MSGRETAIGELDKPNRALEQTLRPEHVQQLRGGRGESNEPDEPNDSHNSQHDDDGDNNDIKH